MPGLTAALAALRPGIAFANLDETLAAVRWDPPLPDGFQPPTQDEVDAEMARLEVIATRIVVSKLRLKLELRDRDLLAGIEAAIAAAPGEEGADARFYWQELVEFESDHALVAAIGAAVGLDQDGIRDIFVAARDRSA